MRPATAGIARRADRFYSPGCGAAAPSASSLRFRAIAYCQPRLKLLRIILNITKQAEHSRTMGAP